MKKIPVFTSILLVVGVFATMAFSHPLVVNNGVVRGYSANNSITIVNHNKMSTYMIPQGAQVLPQNSANGLGAGARVTVVAQCFHGGAASATNKVNNGKQANEHVCVALALIVRSPAAGVVPATGGTGGTAATGTSTPSTGTGGTTAGTSTPSAGTGGTGIATATGTPAVTSGTESATPMLCPTPMMMGTETATPATGTTTGTATATVFPCVTATATP